MFNFPANPTNQIIDVKEVKEIEFDSGIIYRFPNGTFYYRASNDYHCFGYAFLSKDIESTFFGNAAAYARDYLAEHLELDSLHYYHPRTMMVGNRDHAIPIYYVELGDINLFRVKEILTNLQSLDKSIKPSVAAVDVTNTAMGKVVAFKQPKKENILSNIIPVLTNAIDNPDGIPYILSTLPILQTTRDMEFVAGALIGVTRAVRTSLEDMICKDSHPKETQKKMIEEFLNTTQERKHPTATLALWYDNGVYLQMNFLNTVAGYYPFGVWVDGKNLVEDAISDLCNRKNISREELFNLV